MPASASASSNFSADLIGRLSSVDGGAKIKALREVKNQIIGNRTKKVYYIKLGLVPSVVSVLSTASDSDSDLLIQAAAVLGSFSCGVEAGVEAVLSAGALPHLLRLLSSPDEKVVDACARALRMIYRSKRAPKYDFLQGQNMSFLLSLLNSDNENVTGLGASITSHSCQTSAEQKALYDAGVVKELVSLLQGSLSQRDASLESLAILIKNNHEVISKFVGPESGSALSSVIELMKDKNARTRLLACMCLIVIRNGSLCYLEDVGIRNTLVTVLLGLFDDPGQVGDEAFFALASFISDNEDLQKVAFEAGAVDKLRVHLQRNPSHARRLQGILVALAELGSKLESCRSNILSLQVLKSVTDALTHESTEVRAAACICLRSVSRSVKNLSAGSFTDEMIVVPLVQLLHDHSTCVQVAALGAISNIVVDFSVRKSTFMRRGGLKQLVQLAKSMDSTVRLNTAWALRNLVFLADSKRKDMIYSELGAFTFVNLICDHEPSVQEHALALVRNLVDGSIHHVEYAFAEDGVIFQAVGKQLQSALNSEVWIQGMYVLSNLASGAEVHKESVLEILLQQPGKGTQSPLLKFLRSNDSRLRTVTVWAIINLTFPSSPGAFGRVVRLRGATIFSQLKTMVNDPCLDVKLRVRTALGQYLTFVDDSA